MNPTAKPTTLHVVPLVHEEVEITRRPIHVATLRIKKLVSTREQVVAFEPLQREVYDIERVPINRPVEQRDPTRTQGDLTVVPVYEEVVVLRRQLMLKEELHVRRRLTHETPQAQHVTLRHEEVEIQRITSQEESLAISPTLQKGTEQ